MADCSLCDNTGWEPLLIDGVRRVVRCRHLVEQKTQDAKAHPGKFVGIDELLRSKAGLDLLLTPIDQLIGKMIGERHGAAQALPIREIAGRVWPELAADPREFANLARRVKITVEKLRTLAGMAIGASKTEPAGYFIPATAAEHDEMFERHFREGLKHLRIARRHRPSADIVQRLRGQLELQGSGKQGLGIGDQGLAERKDSGPNPQSLNPNPCSPTEAQ